MAVVVKPYDPEWPRQFQEIKSRLSTYLRNGQVVAIEHVGSTAVPGLAAKPIIDIDIIVSREHLQRVIDVLTSDADFTYLGELGIADRHAFRDRDQCPPRNIYVCVDGAFQTRNHLAVRNVLRQNSELREEYANVKLDLAAKGTDIVDYIEAKGSVIQKILKVSGLLSDAELVSVDAANRKGERFGAIKTERLIFREFVMSDVEAFHALESIPEVARYQTWPPRTLEEARKEVVNIIQNSTASPRSHIELAVLHHNIFVGRVGTNIERSSDTTSSDNADLKPARANLWFSFMPKCHGRGFATEAMRAFLPLLGSPLELEIECDPRNTGSGRLAERLGFEQISLTENAFECKGEWVGSLVYQKLV